MSIFFFWGGGGGQAVKSLVTKHSNMVNLIKKILENMSSFCEPQILLFWTFDDGFKYQGGFFVCNRFLRFNSGATSNGLLMASMAAFLIHVLARVYNMVNYTRLFHRTTCTVIDRDVNCVTGCCPRSITRMFARDVI